MKIYTKTGDDGMTGLFGGARVPKNSPRILAYGDIDELNSVIGTVQCEVLPEAIRKSLYEIQSTLFTLGAELASPRSEPKTGVITSSHTSSLERQIDAMTEALSPLKNFILPGGSRAGALLHLARTVCRRAERQIVSLSQTQGEAVDRWVLIYVNRLSDFLFTLARTVNQIDGVEDIPWRGGK